MRHQRVKLCGELARRVNAGRSILSVLLGEAPDLGALIARHLAEKLIEARQQVGLGDQYVHGELDGKFIAQLPEPRTDGLCQARALRFSTAQEFLDAERHDDAIDGLPSAKALQKL